MQSVAALLKQHGVANYNAKDIEACLRALFNTTDEIFADGVNVISLEWRRGWDLSFEVRFYHCNPTQTKSQFAKVYVDGMTDELETACND